MAAKLVIGDVVKLRSDGPWMTVVKDKTEQGTKFVQAAWFDGSALKNEVFHRDTLDAKEPREPNSKEKPAVAGTDPD